MGDEEGGAFPEIGANSAGIKKGNLDAKAADAALDDKRLGSSISLPLTQLIREAKTIEKNAFAPQTPSFDFHASPSLPEQPFEQMEFNSAFAIAMRMEGASKKRGSIISTAPPVKEDSGIEQELKVFGKMPAKDAGSEIGMSPQQASQYSPQKKPGMFSSFLQKFKFTKKKKPNIAPPPFTPLAPASKAQAHGSPQQTSWQPSTSTPLSKTPSASSSSMQKAGEAENSQQMPKKKLFGLFGAKKTPPQKQAEQKDAPPPSPSPSYPPQIPQYKNMGEPAAKGQQSDFSEEKNKSQQAGVQEKPGSPPPPPGIYSGPHYSPSPAQMPKPSQKLRKELEQIDPKKKAKASIFGGLGTPPKRKMPEKKQDDGDDDTGDDEGGMREYDESNAEKAQNSGFSSPIITPKPAGRKIYSSQSVSQMGAGSSQGEDSSFAEASGGQKMQGAAINRESGYEKEISPPQKSAQEKTKQDFGLSTLSNALKAATSPAKGKSEISEQPKTPASAQLMQQKKTSKPRLSGYGTPSDSFSPISEIETHYSSRESAASAKKTQTPASSGVPATPEAREEGISEKNKGTLKFSQKRKISPLPKKKTLEAEQTQGKENISEAPEPPKKKAKISPPAQKSQKAKIPPRASQSAEDDEGGASSLDELEQAAGELGGDEKKQAAPSPQKTNKVSPLASRLGISRTSQKKTLAQPQEQTAKKAVQPGKENPPSARKKPQQEDEDEDEGDGEGGGASAPARKKTLRPAQQEDEDEDEGGGEGAHAVSSRISQKADDILSAPKKEKEKESASKNDDILFAYAKERHKWIYEIYKMGGMTLEEFRSKMNEKMSQDESGSKGDNEREDEKDNSAFSNLDAAANKKFKK